MSHDGPRLGQPRIALVKDEGEFKEDAPASNCGSPACHGKAVAALVQCFHCTRKFTSNSKLHRHISSCDALASDTFHQAAEACQIDVQAISVIKSRVKPCNEPPGMNHSQWEHATIKTYLDKDQPLSTVCLDAGSPISLIDKDFLAKHSPSAIIQKCAQPVPIRGIISGFISTEFALIYLHVPVTLGNTGTLARIRVQAHIAQRLEAKLLVGVDTLAPHGFSLDFATRTATIAACKGAIMPLLVTSKPGQPVSPAPSPAPVPSKVTPISTDCWGSKIDSENIKESEEIKEDQKIQKGGQV